MILKKNWFLITSNIWTIVLCSVVYMMRFNLMVDKDFRKSMNVVLVEAPWEGESNTIQNKYPGDWEKKEKQRFKTTHDLIRTEFVMLPKSLSFTKSPISLIFFPNVWILVMSLLRATKIFEGTFSIVVNWFHPIKQNTHHCHTSSASYCPNSTASFVIITYIWLIQLSCKLMFIRKK